MTTASVCVPVYNGARYVAACVSSILTQTHQDLQLIVVDNASTDGTRAVLAPFLADSRVTLLTSDKTIPAADNWNRALAEAEAEFVKLVCADDVLDATCVERQIQAAQAEPDVVLVAAQRRIIDAAGTVVRPRHGLGRLEGTVPGPTAVRECVRAGTNLLGEPAAVLMRRTALERAGPFDGAYAYLIDLELWCRLLSLGQLVALREPLADFRVHGESWSAGLAAEQAAQTRGLLRRLGRDTAEIRSSDVRRGMLRASVLARGRRIAYRRWSRPEAVTP
jgi:glycosyltransferase involved in cell wall biosynthesis